MGAKGYFILISAMIVAILLGAMAIAITATPEPKAWIYLAAQLCLALVIILFIVLYRKTIKPINILSGGINLLKEQDFSTRLRSVGQTDVDRIIELFNKLTDQLHNEELRIKEQNHFLDLLIAASPMGVLIMDTDYRVSSANPALCRFLGIGSDESIRGKRLSDCEPGLLHLISDIEDENGKIVQTDPLHIYKCTLSHFMDRGFPHPFYMIEPLTEELFEAEKRGYKKVIRIISHEVNNTMAGITSTLGTMKESAVGTEDQDTAAMLSILLSRIDRMSRFITEYASMARLPDPVCTKTDGNAFLRRMMPFMESLKGPREISFALILDENAGKVNIDQVLMEQVLTNIIKNAVESFSCDSPQNAITISSGQDYWCITDNGDPIPEGAADHLFTPFFSTKPEGKGIGLMVIHEILSRSGIKFSLATAPDGITRFEIFFK